MEFRYFQNDAVESVFDYFEARRGILKPANPVVAMPTGTGKSVVIGGVAHQAIMRYPASRLLMATHVKELITQNAKTLLRVWPEAPLGIHSAGLKQRDTAQQIIYGGIKSLLNSRELIGYRDLMLIDEGHLVSPKASTGYRELIKYLQLANPWLKVVMFTATPYRLGQGLLTDEGGIATDICFDITGVEWFNRLIAEGYLSPLIPFRREVGLDLASVAPGSNGDYNQSSLQHAIDKDAITFAALQECVRYAHDRRSWLIFASGVQHAENIANMLWRFGISAAAVHSDMPAAERDARIAAFKRGQLRCLVNMNVLTTGFDHPPIDFIGMLRPTLSPGLWVQMLGRGTRPYDCYLTDDPLLRQYFPYVKQNCLVLDFAGNARRLGPINDPKIPRKKGKGGGLPPVKDCECCGCENHISAITCVNCGAPFVFEVKYKETAYTEELLAPDDHIVEWHNVNRVFYMEHESTKHGKYVRVEYHCMGMDRFSEMLWFGDSWMARKTKDWFRLRNVEPPATIEEALPILHTLPEPSRIRVWENKKPYPQIMNTEFNVWQQSENTHGPILVPS